MKITMRKLFFLNTRHESEQVNNRVWCKYSNELYDVVIEQYYGWLLK